MNEEVLSKELTKARQALKDIAEGDAVQCLVTHHCEGTKECPVHDGQRGCLACQAERRVLNLERELASCRAALDKTAIERDELLLKIPRWQPIDCAPRDGSELLCYVPASRLFAAGVRMLCWDGDEDAWVRHPVTSSPSFSPPTGCRCPSRQRRRDGYCRV